MCSGGKIWSYQIWQPRSNKKYCKSTSLQRNKRKNSAHSNKILIATTPLRVLFIIQAKTEHRDSNRYRFVPHVVSSLFSLHNRVRAEGSRAPSAHWASSYSLLTLIVSIRSRVCAGNFTQAQAAHTQQTPRYLHCHRQIATSCRLRLSLDLRMSSCREISGTAQRIPSHRWDKMLRRGGGERWESNSRGTRGGGTAQRKWKKIKYREVVQH